MRPIERTARFTAAYEATYLDVLRFVHRRAPQGAEDVVAETMTVAWRRVDELPASTDEARAWLFGIARNVLLNHHRSTRRHVALGVRLADATDGVAPDAADEAVSRADLARAWALLDDAEQEVLALTVLDGLTSEQAGRVLAVSAVAYRHRLARARSALRAHLAPTLVQETR